MFTPGIKGPNFIYFSPRTSWHHIIGDEVFSTIFGLRVDVVDRQIFGLSGIGGPGGIKFLVLKIIKEGGSDRLISYDYVFKPK